MADLYVTKVTATGGRHGQIRSEDGLLDLKLAMPKSLGGPGGATNPEQLFAGGYSACFENAVLRAAREAGHKFAYDEVEVVAEIGIRRNEQQVFVLTASLDVTMAGVDQAKAESFVRRGHELCPYSNAIRGNIDVQIAVNVR
jgi:osmotically inducible protein OsmC